MAPLINDNFHGLFLYWAYSSHFYILAVVRILKIFLRITSYFEVTNVTRNRKVNAAEIFQYLGAKSEKDR